MASAADGARWGRRVGCTPAWCALAAAAALLLATPALAPSTPRAATLTSFPQKPADLIALAERMTPVIGAPATPAARADARALNAARPFAAVANPAAAPFLEAVAGDDRDRAVDCLAAAALYEAGDDRIGQQSVVQVVLNRVRSPAFPSSICGVVFQGAGRVTGCQFTFTCDGALRGTPSPAAWRRARQVAQLALGGAVDASVGTATHYHTDWVHPRWSPTLDKVARVGTHLFFRWPGRFGTAAAFTAAYAGAEPRIDTLAALSLAHRLPVLEVSPAALVAQPAMSLPTASLAIPRDVPERLPRIAAAPDRNTFLVPLPRGAPADHLALAARMCGQRSYCKIVGWTDPARVAAAMPMAGSSVDAISFLFVRDRNGATGRARWNCREFARPTPGECLLGR